MKEEKEKEKNKEGTEEQGAKLEFSFDWVVDKGHYRIADTFSRE